MGNEENAPSVTIKAVFGGTGEVDHVSNPHVTQSQKEYDLLKAVINVLKWDGNVGSPGATFVALQTAANAYEGVNIDISSHGNRSIQ